MFKNEFLNLGPCSGIFQFDNSESGLFPIFKTQKMILMYKKDGNLWLCSLAVKMQGMVQRS